MKPPFAMDRPEKKPLLDGRPDRRPCPACGQDLAPLIELARQSGASDAKVVATGDIVIDERLAGFCRESSCANYGLSKSCPPHVSGPAGFRKRLEKTPGALFFKIDVPAEILHALHASEARAVFQLLHETAAAIERAAIAMGFANARAYAGGSCKTVFCHSHDACQALSRNGRCRHPDVARPSMSGFGIDVGKLFKTCGWEMRWVHGRNDATTIPMANVCGLVLVGNKGG